MMSWSHAGQRRVFVKIRPALVAEKRALDIFMLALYATSHWLLHTHYYYTDIVHPAIGVRRVHKRSRCFFRIC